MKVGIVGGGFVGATAAYAMVMGGVGREIVLIDKNEARSRAEANDIYHAVPFARPLKVTSGGYADLKGSRAVIIAAGVNQKPGESRLELLQRNAAVFRDVVPEVLAHAPDAVLVIATNPVDVMTHLAARYAKVHGVSSSRVLGSGTMLDTARFRTLLGSHLGVDPHHVHGYVLGEHGDSEVLTWSLVTVGGIPLKEFCRLRGVQFDVDQRLRIDHSVRGAAYAIIKGKGATYYGVGSALARIVDVILCDQRAILTVCTPLSESWTEGDVTVSLPHLVGEAGVLATFSPVLTPEEESSLQASAAVVRSAIEGLDVPPKT
ncbi:L-lactate dehydrogenase [Geobacter sp. AOG2]|uniref:L-lactate dehydrogenase n=1 Tax=Geobacter sp. AOG2 TaxID=1566347 RepID=UPI001CC4C5F1|nr:L-lactate dehydrogenase [Geobacter sp. AOG2]GFE60687.1 L-lactate dehydrogenase [Geobacter sp. AOG2]